MDRTFQAVPPAPPLAVCLLPLGAGAWVSSREDRAQCRAIRPSLSQAPPRPRRDLGWLFTCVKWGL